MQYSGIKWVGYSDVRPILLGHYCQLLILTEILIVLTNTLLSVTPFYYSAIHHHFFFVVSGTVTTSIGFGVAYPDFKPRLYPAVLLQL